ncbi:hypothetical protein [Tahibacter amnicola]|uniref:Uncharacterized protein n=1 Tax=Tahibacter amnicola TaxID=2976241 RepID=A0ABY6BBR3_9GAMM|nr:hypothetical protein [Tahibacter amnicola]UXI66560.1 hypothetical protein N4264_17630 [Tahibacter amnicola]
MFTFIDLNRNPSVGTSRRRHYAGTYRSRDTYKRPARYAKTDLTDFFPLAAEAVEPTEPSAATEATQA